MQLMGKLAGKSMRPRNDSIPMVKRRYEMNVPKELVDQIARCQCVVFVGAGLSQGAGLPGWPELLQQMLDWSEKRGVDMADRTELESYIEDGDLLLVAEEMHERLGKDNFRSFMAEVFRRPGLKPSDTHMLLPEIPFTAALTSNYDTLLESAYTLTQRGTAPHVFTHSDYPELAAALRSGEFYVLKVHGTIDRIQRTASTWRCFSPLRPCSS
jgi:NAD-dependent SIR2 family protein deacetylase